jgi:hypothetical protein
MINKLSKRIKTLIRFLNKKKKLFKANNKNFKKLKIWLKMRKIKFVKKNKIKIFKNI